MKLKFDVVGKHQPDPFIFEGGGKLYLYVTVKWDGMSRDGIRAFCFTIFRRE